jgi:DNA polymerase alpha subunit B
VVAAGTSLHIFAGQIVCLLATNPTGTCLLVQKIITPPSLSMGTTSGDEYVAYYPDDAPSKHLSILVAAGPFTTNDSLEYEVLQKLLDYVESEQPSVLILLGPFVDIDHPMLKNPVNLQEDLTFEQIFSSKVSSKLMKLVARLPDLKIVLVPSQRDAILEWVAYPQPPLGSAISEQDQIAKLQELGLMSNDGTVSINLFPNPVQFTVNEIIIGISNIDTLLDMIQYGYTISAERDNFTMVFENIIQQRHFYPVFPSSSGTNLDSTRALKTNNGPCALQVKPDILITPSRMMYAVRNAESLCINPGYVVKGKTLGTFAKILVHPLQTEGMGVDDVFEHAVADRSRVEIIKL